MKRIKYAFTWFWAAFKQPEVFQPAFFELVKSMMDFLALTAKAEKPMRSELRIKQLGEILYDDGNKPFLHLWCGVDEMDNPVKRLVELAKENTELKNELRKLKKL